jgi:hypothetical protein
MPRKGDGGLSPEDLLSSFHRVWAAGYQQIARTPQAEALGEWQVLGEELQQGLAAACQEAVRVLEGGEGRRVTTMAAQVNFRYQQIVRGHGHEPLAWDRLQPEEQLLWQALLRHVFNLLSFDPEEDGVVTDHEEKIGDWLRTKLAELPLTDEQRAVRRAEEDSDRERRLPHA